MLRPLTVKNIRIGEGKPKICVPMVGETKEELLEEAKLLSTLDIDLVEWRVDFYQDMENIDLLKGTLASIREMLNSKPLLFTFRSAKEGGEKAVSQQYYVELNLSAIETGLIDLVDVELYSEEDVVKSVIQTAHSQEVFVIISNHDFKKTPSKEEIVSRLRKAQELGGDIPKIAVMPKDTQDVLTLLEATNEMKHQYADRPIITMAMGGQGVISRLSGEIFGSAITFGAAKKTSAPGQIHVNQLRSVLDVIHENL
ncbi:type I 3-dehydroquinate dehydratase [Oceanobacillus salinisoli]|uniref:type I 3-dehydroquinate dehydratase n=1 Tax=Oceanobacillus salinisoli TaxID=2678611 RepID=UPI0012E1ECAF|nr:type I 3-dehydroquinate dehydratase [Oceanobacillus salinisoli]